MSSLGRKPPSEPEDMPVVTGVVKTHVPSKWALVDTETNQIWALGGDGGWSHGTAGLSQRVMETAKITLTRDER